MENRVVKRFVAPAFKGDMKSYPFWKKRMEIFLRQEDLFYTLENSPEEENYFNPVANATPEQETERKQKLEKRLKDDGAAVNEFFTALDDEALIHVMECTNAKEITKRLDEVYLPKGPVAMLGLRSRLYLLKNENFSSLQQLFTSHEEIIIQLNNMGEHISQEEQLNTLLVAIPDKFNYLLGALSVLRKEDLTQMSLQQVKRIFLDEDQKNADSRGNKMKPEAAFVGNNPRQKGKPGNRNKKNYEKHITCFGCGKIGHRKQNCIEEKHRDQASLVEEVVEDVALLAASAIAPVSNDKQALPTASPTPKNVALLTTPEAPVVNESAHMQETPSPIRSSTSGFKLSDMVPLVVTFDCPRILSPIPSTPKVSPRVVKIASPIVSPRVQNEQLSSLKVTVNSSTSSSAGARRIVAVASPDASPEVQDEPVLPASINSSTSSLAGVQQAKGSAVTDNDSAELEAPKSTVPHTQTVHRQNGSFMVRIPLDRIELCAIGKIRHDRGDPFCPKLKEAVTNQYIRNMTMNDMPVKVPGVLPMYLDSGASRHMVREKRCFDELWDTKPVIVQTAEERTQLRGSREGNIRVKSKVGNKVFISTMYNVLFVPNLSCNLLSVSQLESNGKSVLFQNGKVKILDKEGNIIAEGVKENGLYCLKFFLINSEENAHVSKEEQYELWHQRFGHLGKDNMFKLIKNDMVQGLDIKNSSISTELCQPCLAGKQTRNPFNKNKESRSRRPLELVHSDVWGPSPEPNHDGSRYFVSFIDDFTHFTRTYLISHKSDVFQKFQEFEALATAHFSLKITKLRTDNGGEYYSNEFIKFCKSKGIELTPTVPYTPQQNGVSERMNRTLMDKARSMMHDKDVPESLWGEALFVSTYLTNRSPTIALEACKTPYELWFGDKPDVSKLKVFGCVAYSLVNQVHRSKLDKRNRILGMVGYAHNGYRLWDKEERKIVISRDVVFDENKSYFQIQSESSRSKETSPVLVEFSDEPVELTQPDEDVERDVESDRSSDSDEDFQEALDPLDEEFEILNRRSGRLRRPPNWLSDYETGLIAGNGSANIPQNIRELMNRDDWNEWKKAIAEEMKALHDNETWTLIQSVPDGRKAINSMWIFTIKNDTDSPRYKARLVAKGCAQSAGIDYTETFAPVAKMTTIRTLLSIAVQYDLQIHQMDVKTAFLNGNLKEEIYMKLPPGEDGIVRTCQLKKCLYGLKQASRSWNERFDQIIISMGFTRLRSDSCVYILKDKNIYLVLYVDDMLIFGKDAKCIKWIKESLSKHFQMKDIGSVKNFLGLEIFRETGVLEVSQQSYVERILQNFGMENCKPVSTPISTSGKWKRDEGILTTKPYKALLGCLQYLALMSRPDLCFSVNFFSQFQSSPSDSHWSGLQRILRYLQGTKTYRLVYHRSTNEAPLTGYADADFANGLDDRRSTSGIMYTVFGNTVSWKTKKQTLVVLSSTEAEFVALCEASKEGMWLSNLLHEIGIDVLPFRIHEDNIPCISIAEEPRHHQRTKHIDIKYAFVRELIKEKKIELNYIPTDFQLADIFTKALGEAKFSKFVSALNLKK